MKELYFIAAIIISCAVGNLSSEPWGWLTFGAFVLLAALMSYLGLPED